ncbi:hypothetical protein [Microcoleus sp. FACHB-68]|uniref:hypothetical protein n=1 Tax=Microcoleus sp. FACHB-68 TaxID=2692826 RepID=UPI001686AD04|nr:hypothetical protein [Microcoleus sp. FACHB-68]MBD1938286.1 hypothetical protein [Microcoleus sp. FACHB-68]
MRKRLLLGLLVFTLLLGLVFVLFSSNENSKRPFALPASALEEPWPVQSGLRIATLNSKISTVNRVVLVPDEATFLAAIRQWSLEGRWPVLIEDNKYTPMFLQRFEPAEVIRVPAVKDSLPKGETLQNSMLQAVAAAWNATDMESLKQAWKRLGWEPPGVVITSQNDPAWPAAVALAADRGQPLVFLEDNFGQPNDTLSAEQMQRLETSIENTVKQTGYPYKKLGDSIDTITLVRDLGVKYQSLKNAKDQLAVTDGLARNKNGERWAVAGWIAGSPARAVYQAMCAIFLEPKTAMLYNSYQQKGSWLEYEMSLAASELKNIGVKIQAVQQPQADLEKWRDLTAREWEFDLVFVNSSGDKASFNVGKGQAVVDDVPKLKFPAAVHFIHSWSATTPDDPETVGGRWLENGAYLYAGSVHEPFLSAFIPPKLMVKRMMRSAPFLLSARQLESPPWKVTTIGDPLTIFTKQRRKIPPTYLPIPK